MSGLRLAEMEMSEMLDVIHVLLEEDYSNAVSKEQVDARTRIRKVMYKEFYNRTLNYGEEDFSIEPPLEPSVDYSDVKPFDPKKATAKPYIPPTNFNPEAPMPFGKNIDAPLG
jgi:hypothetical protein